jgi:hypothetical protein
MIDLLPNQVAGANAYWSSQIRFRGQRRGYGATQLFSLDVLALC